MSLDRAISLGIAACWLLVAYLVGAFGDRPPTAKGDLPSVAASLLAPLGLIWFGEGLGDYVGPSRHGYVTQRTPGCLVKAFGWASLASIIGAWIYVWATRKA